MKYIWITLCVVVMLIYWSCHQKTALSPPPWKQSPVPSKNHSPTDHAGTDAKTQRSVDEASDPLSVAAAGRLARAFEVTRSTASYRLSERKVLPNGDYVDIVLFRSSAPGQGLRQRKEVRQFQPDGTLTGSRVDVYSKDLSFTVLGETAFVVLEPIPPADHAIFDMIGPFTVSEKSPIVYRQSKTTLGDGTPAEVVTADNSLFIEQFGKSGLKLLTIAEWFIDPSTGLLLGMAAGGGNGTSSDHTEVYTKAEVGGADDDSLYQLPSEVEVRYINTVYDLPKATSGGG